MSVAGDATVHASCVLVGRSAVLIRGPSGSGKSRLAEALLEAGRSGLLPHAWLVADDRVRLIPAHGRLVAAAPDAIRGQIEVRAFGIRRRECEPLALVGLVVDLEAQDAARLPEPGGLKTEILGIMLSRLPVGPGEQALPPVLAALFPITEA
ncbi:MAG: HPr kinase/phosphatase C-terminal domain-containing protein [Xanthobacteraceae bacterium]|nr:HPr kinase/phosphatase C-terminal domain-containing protein [Xanthobacteraceae bacterium]